MARNENDRNSSLKNVPSHLSPIALRKANIVYNFGLSECSRANKMVDKIFSSFTLLPKQSSTGLNSEVSNLGNFLEQHKNK